MSELILHDGRNLPETADLRRALRVGLDAALAEAFEARGGQEVERPEDAYPLLRRLGAMSETARDYGRAFTEFAREVEARAGDDLCEMFGEQDGIPNNGAKVPDADGTTISVQPDYLNEYDIDIDALTGGLIAQLLGEDEFTAALGAMFQAEFKGDVDGAANNLAWVLAEAMTRIVALGKFTPQVTKVRALAKQRSTASDDLAASVITGAIKKTVKQRGIKITREQPKEPK